MLHVYYYLRATIAMAINTTISTATIAEIIPPTIPPVLLLLVVAVGPGTASTTTQQH